jgi:hypothetical protein
MGHRYSRTLHITAKCESLEAKKKQVNACFFFARCLVLSALSPGSNQAVVNAMVSYIAPPPALTLVAWKVTVLLPTLHEEAEKVKVSR